MVRYFQERGAGARTAVPAPEPYISAPSDATCRSGRRLRPLSSLRGGAAEKLRGIAATIHPAPRHRIVRDPRREAPIPDPARRMPGRDRKSVVWGTSVSVGVD